MRVERGRGGGSRASRHAAARANRGGTAVRPRGRRRAPATPGSRGGRCRRDAGTPCSVAGRARAGSIRRLQTMPRARRAPTRRRARARARATPVRARSRPERATRAGRCGSAVGDVTCRSVPSGRRLTQRVSRSRRSPRKNRRWNSRAAAGTYGRVRMCSTDVQWRARVARRPSREPERERWHPSVEPGSDEPHHWEGSSCAAAVLRWP